MASGVVNGAPFWTPERVDQLRMLWMAGKSATECARALGATRNQVIGKVDRCGMKRPEPLKIERPQTQRERKPSGAHKQNFSYGKGRYFPPEPAAPPSPDQPLPESRPVRLVQLKRLHCRWPIGDPKQPGFHFCGAWIDRDRKGFSQRPFYCEAHARLSTADRQVAPRVTWFPGVRAS